jgi:hypothetical protein
MLEKQVMICFGINILTKKGDSIMKKKTNLNNIPKSFLDYLRVIVFDNVDFYEISTKDIIQMWNDTENKEAFKDEEIV